MRLVKLVVALVMLAVAAPPASAQFGELFKQELEKEKAKRAAEEAKKRGAAPAPATDGKSQPALADTELTGFFERHPQPGGSRVADWPRVVITMVEAPAWHLDRPTATGVNSTPGPGCWAFTAKIWESETQQRDVPKFSRCAAEGLKTPQSDEGIMYLVWTGLNGPPRPSAGLRRGTTGAERTDGPNPPDTPLPSSAAYRRVGFHQTYSGFAIYTVVRTMGLVYATNERRLWVNVAPELAPTLDAR